MARSFDVRRQKGFTTIAMIAFFMLYLPIAVLVIFAFNAGENFSQWEGLSLRWFEKAINNVEVIDA
jgi:spermidine/putrescine transport system permease protein